MRVDVQDFGVVEFPDDASDREIQDALNDLFPSQPDVGPTIEPPRSSEELAQRNFEAEQAIRRSGVLTLPERPPSLSQEITSALSVSPQTVQNASEVFRANQIANNLRAMGIEVPREQVLADVAGGREVAPSPGAQVVSGAQNVAAGLIGGMTDPTLAAPVAAAALFPPIAPLVSGGFGAHMLSQVPELARAAGEASAVGTPYEKARAYGDLGAAALFIPSLAAHAASPLTRPSIERIPNALDKEAESVLRNVRQPEVTTEGARQVPTTESGAKIDETLARDILYKEAESAKKQAESEWPPQYKKIKESTGASESELDALGITEVMLHPSEYRNLSRELSRNAPGGKLNQLYNRIAPEGKTGRFIWGGTAENPKLGFEPDIRGAVPDAASARRALDIVNKVKESMGDVPLPDFFSLSSLKLPDKLTPQVNEFISEFSKTEWQSKITNASDNPDMITTNNVGEAVNSMSDLNALLDINVKARERLGELRELRGQRELTPAEANEYFRLAGTVQFPREVIERATNVGSGAQEMRRPWEKEIEPKLDWKKNEEVRQWLLTNAEKIWSDDPLIQNKATLEKGGETIEKAKEAEVLTQPGLTSEQVPALGYLPRQSEALGLGEPALPPTVESIRAQREIEARQGKPIVEPSGTTTFPTESESVKMRKSAERATTAEMIPEPVQETIKTAPESFYRQQSVKRVEDIVTEMADADLAAVPRDSNIYTAAKLEQASRLFKKGDNDAGYNVFVELEKEGTRLGQLVNQFKLLKGTRPEEIARVINKTLEKSGKDPLNTNQEKEAIKTAEKSKEADRKLEDTTKEWEKNPTPENAAKAEDALATSNEAALDLQRFVAKFQPRSTASMLKAILQGNLLTPISQVANIVGNVSFLPFRAATRGVATSLDVLDNYVRGTKRKITVQLVSGTAEALKGFGRGVKQMPDIFLKGTGETIKGETRAGLHPIRAWINQFAKEPEMPTTGGKLTLQDRVNLAIEGTLGVPAEAMLRGLGAGDVAFKEAAKARATATELELAGVPKEQWSFAQKFPELFLDKEALSRVQSDTLQAVFQRPSTTLNVITNWIRGRGEWFDLALATVAPYKLTPWNIVGEILSYNPLIAFGRAIHESKNGNSRAAKLNAGKFVVGGALTAAGWWLYKHGLMSPSLDQRDEAQKARILAGEVLPPNHINISGLERALKGGDPTFKPGDETADVFRAGGLAGSMFYMTANIGRDFERMPEVPDSEIWGAILRQSTLEQARFGMNQSFLSGVEGLLAAVREGNADNYIRQWGNTVSSIPLPNTMTVMSRASREYKPEFREDTFKKQMENIVRNKLGFAGLDDYLPLKRGLWGEPMRETPEGRNAIMYHFFDVFKNKQVTSDPVPLELFRLWRKTTDTRVIPSLPEKSLTIGGNTYMLNADQQSRYAELVGQSRRAITDAIVVNPNFHNLPDEKKIDLLDKVYRTGMERGKALFWREIGGSGVLKQKPTRAGFDGAPPQ